MRGIFDQRAASCRHNNTSTVLNTMLKKAVEWEVIDRLPCTIKLLRVVHGDASFHNFADYEWLIEAARAIGWRTHLLVLLSG